MEGVVHLQCVLLASVYAEPATPTFSECVGGHLGYPGRGNWAGNRNLSSRIYTEIRMEDLEASGRQLELQKAEVGDWME